MHIIISDNYTVIYTVIATLEFVHVVDSDDFVYRSHFLLGSAVPPWWSWWSGRGMASTTHWAASYNRPMVCTQLPHLDNIITVSVTCLPPHTVLTLYDCREIASGCSECLASRIGSEFTCGWCEDSCEVMQECSNSFITEGGSCPAPVINSFTPMSGKWCSLYNVMISTIASSPCPLFF